MKTRTKKRMLSILLSALMCIWLIQPVPLWAAAAGDPSDDVAVSLPDGAESDDAADVLQLLDSEGVPAASGFTTEDNRVTITEHGTWTALLRGADPAAELSVAAEKFDIIAKSLEPLPEKFHGMTDVEARYRQRYVDMIINDEAKAVLITRCKIISAVREYFNNNGFLEVETPTLHPIMGGASAKPFITHYNALDNDFYLRVAPELYLKKLIVGGMDRVFEIGKNFRNEGIDKNHNPEFTALEAYMAYADYHDGAELISGVIRYVAKRVFGKEEFQVGDYTIDVSKPFEKISMIDLIKRECGINLLDAATVEEARAMAKQAGVNADDCDCWGKVVVAVFDEKVEHKLIQPIHVMDMPRDVSPLAKTHRSEPRLVEHFDTYIAGMEVGCSYSELSNPLEQRERFEAQVKARENGDDEAQARRAMRIGGDVVCAADAGHDVLGECFAIHR